TFELRPFSVAFARATIPLAYPYPSLFYNVSAQAFLALKGWMLPPNVLLLNLGVGDSVIVQLEIGALLTLILGMPWIVHEAGAFLVPALRHNERALLRWIGIPATALFAVGTLLGILFLTPLTFRLLFDYVAAMGIAPVLGIQAFVEFALLYSLAFCVAFELPIFVYGLTRLGVVRAASWRKHWRGAVIGALVFGMIVTPDNSGITMLLVAAPMMALYFGGVFFATRWEGRSAAPPLGAAGA
ncbi:MAG TPA: twin-arginine translocase subunit TatC, partial [Thermoplasmata archaeon]|nr:twin-arginine translocase subunit TatC [Thermoplasmata archaeon]